MEIQGKEKIKNVICKIRYDIKENDMDTLINQAEGEEPEALCRLGWLLRYHLNDNQLSKRCFEIAGNKDYGRAYFLLSSMPQNSRAEEMEYLWQGAALKDPQCYCTLARALDGEGQWQDALELLKRGTDEGIDECGLELSRRYKRAGRKSEAIEVVSTLAMDGGRECLSQLGAWMCQGYLGEDGYKDGIKLLNTSRALGSYRADIFLRREGEK